MYHIKKNTSYNIIQVTYLCNDQRSWKHKSEEEKRIWSPSLNEQFEPRWVTKQTENDLGYQ